MPEDQIVVITRRIASAAGDTTAPFTPAIPAATPPQTVQASFVASKLESAKWAQIIVRRYVTVATDYSTLAEMASAVDRLVFDIEDEGLEQVPAIILESACKAGRNLRDSFLIQANMAQKSSDPQFNPLLLRQGSDRITEDFATFVLALNRLFAAL